MLINRTRDFFHHYMKSWVAKSLISLLFPQLGAVSDEKLKITIEKLKAVFGDAPLINLIKEEKDQLSLSKDVEFGGNINTFLKFYLKKHIDEQIVDDVYSVEEVG